MSAPGAVVVPSAAGAFAGAAESEISAKCRKPAETSWPRHFGDLAVVHRLVAADENLHFRIVVRDCGDSGAELLGGKFRFLKENLALLVDRDDQRLGPDPASPSAAVFGRSTGTPTVSSGAVIMKMTSSTSMTSTIGVTLISAIGCALRRWMPRCGRAPSLTAMVSASPQAGATGWRRTRRRTPPAGCCSA